MRRGLSEIVGGMIVLAAVLAGTIALALAVDKATDNASRVLEEKIERASSEADPIMILPYVVGNSTTLRLYIAPLEPSSNITVLIVGKDSVQARTLQVNSTYVDAVVINNYDCGDVIIAVIDGNGAIHFYNALRDPRVNLTLVRNPHVFSCSLITTSAGWGEYSSILGLQAVSLEAPPAIGTQNVKSYKTLTFYIYGYFKARGESPGCNYRIEDQNRNVIARGLACESRTLIYNGSDYTIWFRTKWGEGTIVGYLVVESPGIAEGQVRVRMTSDKTYLKPPEGYATFGELNNIIIPIIVAPLAKPASLYYEARVYPPDSTGRVSISIRGDATGHFWTEKPIILFVSSTSVPRLYVSVRVDLTLYGYTIIQADTAPRELRLRTCGPFRVEAKPLVPIDPADIIADAVNTIPAEDWGSPIPAIKAAVINEGRMRIIMREIRLNDTIIIDYDNITNASILYLPGKLMPPLTSYNLTIAHTVDGTAYVTSINGTSIMSPIASNSHIPLLLVYDSPCGKINVVLVPDNPIFLDSEGLPNSSDGNGIILRTIGPTVIDPNSINASKICLIKGDINRFTSTGISAVETCSTEPLEIEAQSFYLIVALREDWPLYNGFLYRLLWSN